ncbi:MAG TPA: hypothetical protein VEZ55_15165 [Chitinophagaceae bacterium]|jgi:hypothetical protein|nr:hypothetical protein [Chitinophagaceae bacterium]
MTLPTSFIFRNKEYSFEFFIDNSAFPCFIFVLLKDTDLIEEFGEEVTIKTDGVSCLPKNDDYRDLVALRQSLFDAIKPTQSFLLRTAELRLVEHSQSRNAKNIQQEIEQ